MILQQIGFRDPAGANWPIKMRTENLGQEIYDDEIWIKIAKDTNLDMIYSGGYYRKADYELGGEWQVMDFLWLIVYDFVENISSGFRG